MVCSVTRLLEWMCIVMCGNELDEMGRGGDSRFSPYPNGFIIQKGLKNVFDEAILAALEPPQQEKKRKCVIL